MKKLITIVGLLVLSCIGAIDNAPRRLDLVVVGQSLAGAGLRCLPETIPALELEGSDVRRWFNGDWAQALASSGGESPPGIGQWAAKLARTSIEIGDHDRVHFISLIQSGATLAQLSPGTANFSNWSADIAASGTAAKVAVLWQGASDSANANYEAELTTLWSAMKAAAPTLDDLLIVEAYDLVDGVSLQCGNDMWRVRAARAAFADANADVHLLDLGHIPLSPIDQCHLCWHSNKLAGEAIRKAVVSLGQ